MLPTSILEIPKGLIPVLMFLGRFEVPLALNEPILRWCGESETEIPDIEIQRTASMFTPYRVFLIFSDPNAALAFKMRWF